MARPVARRPFDGDQPAVEVVAERRQPGVAHSDRQPVVAGRVRQSPLSEFAGRRSREHAGAPGRDRCRDRQGRVGEALQPVPQRRAAAPRRRGRRPRSILKPATSTSSPSRAQLICVAPDGKDPVGSIAARRVRRGDHARRPHHVADRRGRQGDPERADPRVGRSQSHRQPLFRVRQEDRPDGLDQLAAGAPLRHQLFDADRRAPSTARAR